MVATTKREVLKLAKAALKTDAGELIHLTEEITRLLEKETGQIGNMLIKGKLITVEPEGNAVIVGDIHGDIESLLRILNESNFMEKAEKQKDVLLIFLGDYGDRGPYSAEVYYIILKLKQQFPENVILMRGNHEGPEDILAYPHDLPIQFQQRFSNHGNTVYSIVRRLFHQFYNAVLVKNRYILIHGGFPTKAQSLDDFAYAQEKHPKEIFLEEMLWNDPEENIKGTYPSPRGAGKLFGEDITATFLEMLQVNRLIRGHEPSSDGFKLNHNGKVLTLFSRKGAPYNNKHGAYLKIDFSRPTENVRELLCWIHKF